MNNRFDRTLPKKIPKLSEFRPSNLVTKGDREKESKEGDSTQSASRSSQPIGETENRPSIENGTHEAGYTLKSDISASRKITQLSEEKLSSSQEEEFPTRIEGVPFNLLSLGEKTALLHKMIKEVSWIFGKLYHQKLSLENELNSLEKEVLNCNSENRHFKEECQGFAIQCGMLEELRVEKALLLEEKETQVMRIHDHEKTVNTQLKCIADLEAKMKDISEKEAKLQKIAELKIEIENMEVKKTNLARRLSQLSADKEKSREKVTALKKEQDEMLKIAEDLEEVRQAILS
ncbi:MAG: hypothetical protein HQM09_03980 [Candidatus Riflebacteria bacterium]|nr:hypothetical protein [Candidatus Riflebacteria bacterium]